MKNKTIKANSYDLPASLPQEGLEKPEKEPFIPFPRYLIEHLRNRLITYRELELYVWMRLHTNMFGIAAISTYEILDNLPHFKSVDYITKRLRSLRKKKYIYYEDRQGCRGSFEVYFGNWLLKGGVVKQLDKFFDIKEVRSENAQKEKGESEVAPISDTQSPKSDNPKIATNTNDYRYETGVVVRSNKNDKEIENKEQRNNVVDDCVPNNKKINESKILTSKFVPQNDAEARCREIALEIGDQYINFILSKLHHEYCGIEVIEEAYKRFLEVERVGEEKGDPIENRPAMFNYCLQGAMGDKELEEREKNKGIKQ